MYYFIVNEFGGSGKTLKCWKKIKKVLEKKNIKYESFITEYQGHAEFLAKNISGKKDKDIKIVIVGGDGTVNEVVNGITNFEKVQLGIIPSGSGNDFARGLNLFIKNSTKALNQILDSTSFKTIDVGILKTKDVQRKFAISSGFGLDALVSATLNKSKLKSILNKLKLGKIGYAIFTVLSLLKLKTQTVSLSFDNEPQIEFSKLIFAASMNCVAEGGGVPMAPNAKIDDSKLSVCIAYNLPKWKTFLLFPFLLMAKHTKLKSFYLRDFKTLDIYSQIDCVVHTDGEEIGKVNFAHVECVPNKLKILI